LPLAVSDALFGDCSKQLAIREQIAAFYRIPPHEREKIYGTEITERLEIQITNDNDDVDCDGEVEAIVDHSSVVKEKGVYCSLTDVFIVALLYRVNIDVFISDDINVQNRYQYQYQYHGTGKKSFNIRKEEFRVPNAFCMIRLLYKEEHFEAVFSLSEFDRSLLGRNATFKELKNFSESGPFYDTFLGTVTAYDLVSSSPSRFLYTIEISGKKAEKKSLTEYEVQRSLRLADSATPVGAKRKRCNVGPVIVYRAFHY